MKLSEAIREGAKLRPQGFDDYFPKQRVDVDDDIVTCSCALGAAFEAYMIDRGGTSIEAVRASSWEIEWEDLGGEKFNRPCPACPRENFPVIGQCISHLNDHHRWTREEIADWVQREGL